MSQANQNEDIDLTQLFRMITEFFRKAIGLFVDAVLFIRNKIILFLILGVIGGGLGYFLDQFQNKKSSFVQEIVLEPKYNSVEYIYDIVEDLEDNLEDNSFVNNKLGVDSEHIKNLKDITLLPIIRPEEVLGQLQDKESFTEIYNEKLLKEKKYRNFYKQHKLSVLFKNDDADNEKITNAILKLLESNKHFLKVINLELKQTENNLEQNKKTLKFVNNYLTNLSENPTSGADKIIFASESETPTISSLLKRKEELMGAISEQEKLLALDRSMYTVIEDTGVIAKRKMLIKRMLFIVPLILVGIVMAFYFLSFLIRSAVNFVNQK